MEEVKVFYILDPNDFEYFDEEDQTLQEYVEATGISKQEFRKKVISLLEDYYEVHSNYGNPIEDIVRYVPEDKLKDLIEDYNYLVFDDIDNAIKHIEKEISK